MSVRTRTANNHGRRARDASPAEEWSGWPLPAIGLALALAGLGFAYATTWVDLMAVWWRSQTYQYALLVPPTVLYLLYVRRGRIAAARPAGAAAGVIAAGGCGLVWLAADLAGANEGTHLAVVAAGIAVTWATLGNRAVCKVLPPLALLVFLVPTGQQLLPWLRDLTVAMAILGPNLLDIPTETSGYTFTVAGRGYIAIDDCAGLGELLATTFLGATFGLLIYRRIWKVVALACVAALISIVANGLRVNAIVLVNHWNGTVMDMTAHRAMGWWTIALATAALFLLAVRYRDDDSPHTDQGQGNVQQARPARATICGLLAAVVAIAVPLAWPVGLSHDATATVELPDEFGAWRLTAATPSWSPDAERADIVRRGVYGKGERRVAVFVAQAKSPRSETSGPSLNLLPDDTWWLKAAGRRFVCDEGTCWPVRTLLLDHSNGPRVQHADVLTLLNGRPETSATALRLKRAWQTLTGRPAAVTVLALAIEETAPLPPTEAAFLFSHLRAQVLPPQ